MKNTYSILLIILFLIPLSGMGQDSDCDGMSDADEESLTGYDKHDNDSDDNGVSDGAQFAWGGGPDTDFDGLPDYYENPDWGSSTDPLIADTDGDGFCDGYEVSYGMGDPLHPDIDADGLNDSLEFAYGTSWSNPDTDADGIDDSTEIFVHLTDPLKANTDNDCWDDSTEVALSLDPLDSTDASPQDWFLDDDGDGFGDVTVHSVGCTAPLAYVMDSTDCDDTDSTIHPEALEIPGDLIDQDCDGMDEVITSYKGISSFKLLVYPQPAHGLLVCELSGSDKPLTFSLLNTLGEEVHRLVSDGPYAEMDVSSLARGIYYLKVHSLMGERTVERILLK